MSDTDDPKPPEAATSDGAPEPEETKPVGEPERKTVDPVEEVERQVADKRREIRSLDDLPEDVRDKVERYTSARVNEALESKKKKGDFIPAPEHKRALEDLRKSIMEELKERDEARDTLYERLSEHGIAPGSKEFKEFSETYNRGPFSGDALTDPEALAFVVAAMPSRQKRGDTEEERPVTPGSGLPGSLQLGDGPGGETKEQVLYPGGDANEAIKASMESDHRRQEFAANLMKEARKKGLLSG